MIWLLLLASARSRSPPRATLHQAEAQDEVARLRAELTAALALGGGGGRVDVASVVLGPKRSGGALAWRAVAWTAVAAQCGTADNLFGL